MWSWFCNWDMVSPIFVHSQTVPDPPLKFAAPVWRIVCSVASAKCSHRDPCAPLRSECNVDICVHWYTRIRDFFQFIIKLGADSSHAGRWCCSYTPTCSGTLASIGAQAAGIPYFPASMSLAHHWGHCSFWCEASDRNLKSVANLVPLCPALCVWVVDHECRRTARSRSVDFEPLAKNKDVDVQKAEPGSEIFKMPSILAHYFSILCVKNVSWLSVDGLRRL